MTYARNPSGGGNNPFVEYGRRASQEILGWLSRMPPAERGNALRALLQAVDPKLRSEIERKTVAYRAKGAGPRALELAVAASFANGLAEETVRLGRGRSAGPLTALSGSFADAVTSAATGGMSGPTERITIDVGGMKFEGVTKYKDSGVMTYSKTYRSPGGFQGLRLPAPIDAAFRKKYNWALSVMPAVLPKAVATGGAPLIKFASPAHGVYVKLDTGMINDDIKSAVVTIKKIPPPDKNMLEKGVDVFTGMVTLPFKVVAKAPALVIGATGAVLNKLGDLACKAVNSDLAPYAGAGAAGAMGGSAQAGATGVAVAQQICGGGGGAGGPAGPAPTPFPWVPLAIAGGGLVLVILAVRE